MAQYKVKFTCGHEDIIDLDGSMKKREWILSQKKDDVCPKCQETLNKIAKEKADMRKAERTQELGLPSLNGSEWQIKQAVELRFRMIENIEKEINKNNEMKRREMWERLENRKTMYSYDLSSNDIINQIGDYILKNKTDAKWYINMMREISTMLHITKILDICNKEMNEGGGTHS